MNNDMRVKKSLNLTEELSFLIKMNFKRIYRKIKEALYS